MKGYQLPVLKFCRNGNLAMGQCGYLEGAVGVGDVLAVEQCSDKLVTSCSVCCSLATLCEPVFGTGGLRRSGERLREPTLCGPDRALSPRSPGTH